MNNPLRALSQPLKWVLRRFLANPAFRRRIVFELRQNYYGDFECLVPLGHGLQCPITFWEAWASFGFIFFEGEYARAFKEMQPPSRWIDLGCYAGHFSLYIAQLRAQRGFSGFGEAFLVDADSRTEGAVQKVLRVNRFDSKWSFLKGAISREMGRVSFVERSFMTSSLSSDATDRKGVVEVDVIAPAQILSAFPPPYDLIKIDIEGGEYDFLLAYSEVLARTEYLLIEWHGWHSGGGGEAQIRALAEDRGFLFVCEVLAPREVQHRAAAENSGVHLYRRAR